MLVATRYLGDLGQYKCRRSLSTKSLYHSHTVPQSQYKECVPLLAAMMPFMELVLTFLAAVAAAVYGGRERRRGAASTFSAPRRPNVLPPTLLPTRHALSPTVLLYALCIKPYCLFPRTKQYTLLLCPGRYALYYPTRSLYYATVLQYDFAYCIVPRSVFCTAFASGRHPTHRHRQRPVL